MVRSVLLEKHLSLNSCVLQDIQILILKPQSDPGSGPHPYAHLSILILIQVLVFVSVRVPVRVRVLLAQRLLMIYMNIELNFFWQHAKVNLKPDRYNQD